MVLHKKNIKISYFYHRIVLDFQQFRGFSEGIAATAVKQQ